MEEEIKKIIEKYPNDNDLGKVIRHLYTNVRVDKIDPNQTVMDL